MKIKLTIILSLALVIHAFAGSATWNLNPVSGNWNDPANWTPNTVPDGPEDVATFGVSTVTAVSLSGFIELDSLIIEPGASAFTFTALSGSLLTFSGSGIANNSGIGQSFTTDDPESGSSGAIQFNGSATAGTDTVFTNTYSINFDQSGSAGDATLVCSGGYTYFYGDSTAANATIIANGSSSAEVGFSLVSLGSGAAANATLIANDGTIAGGEIGIGFIGQQGTNTARVQLYGKGNLIANSGNIGSLEGNGLVIIEPFENLHIGGNNLSTTFSGQIKGDKPFADPEGKGDLNGVSSIVDNDRPSSPSGAVTKDGTGTLTLSGRGTYSAGTTITAGTLLVSNESGSGTGNAPVDVIEGTLGGGGIIAGAVTVGSGSGTGAFLAPAPGPKKQTALTIQSALTFNADATYTYTFRARGGKARSDKVIANGVTINSGAFFAFQGTAQGTLNPGLSFTAISNTGAAAIAGTFSNLPDGAILTVNGNNFQADYEGGDGNDLTLTVVP
jgi:autotransporter-associated beta strand protein